MTDGPSFTTFANNLRAYQVARSEDAKAFWKHEREKYGTQGGDLALPPHSMPQPCSAHEERVEFNFPLARLRNTARMCHVGVSSLIFAAWAGTVSTICDSDHVRFGVVLSGRNVAVPYAETIVGPLISTLPLNIRINASTTFMELAKHIHLRTARLSEYSWTLPEHGYSQNYSSALSIQVGDANSPPLSKAWSTSITRFPSQLPLSISVEAEGLVCVQYQTAKMSRFTAENITNILAHTLDAIATDGTRVCRSIPHSMESRLRIQSQCYSPRTRQAFERSNLVSLFQSAAAGGVTDAAVEKSGSKLTYAELDHMSDKLAWAIEPYISPGDVVGVYADRSLNWIVAVYAVLKAGGIYCPFHNSLSPMVRDEQFQAARITLFLFPNLVDMIDTNKPAGCQVCLSVEDVLVAETSKELPFQGPPIRPEDAAYLCFTSGSSGKPKGVLCKHGGLVAFQRDFDVRLRARSGWKIAQTMSPCFDGSIHEIFSCLSYGATLVLPNEEKDPFEHLGHVDAAILTPTVASALQPEATGRLSVVYLVGESVPQHVCDQWAAQMTVFNMYGPTEATCGATITQLFPGVPVRIGRPNPSSRVYVLDRHHNLTPPGILGEVYIAGVQVAKGYLDLPNLNRERFLEDTVCPEIPERMYKTGDLGYWDEAGQLALLGRDDRQIKYRGFRVDMDDIEARVRAGVPQAHGVAVLLDHDWLVVILTPRALQAEVVKQQLAKCLPSHVMPRIYVMEKLPVTRAGKLDYRSASRIVQSTSGDLGDVVLGTSANHSEDLSNTEFQIADFWREVLQLPADLPLSPASSFMELGGESISALRLRGKVEHVLGRQLPLTNILTTSTLREMAFVVERSKPSLSSPSIGIVQEDFDTISPLSAMERSLCALNKGNMTSNALNVSLLCNLDPRVNVGRLTDSLNQILSRHTILRSHYHGLDDLDKAFRTITESPPEVSLVTSADLHSQTEINRPFNLEAEDLMRVFVSPSELLVVAHHIILDLTALRKLMRQVQQSYDGVEIAPDGASYVSRKFLNGPEMFGPRDRERVSFWDGYLENRPLTYSPHRSRAGGSFVTRLEPEFWAHIQQFARLQQVTAHHFFLAAAALATSPCTDEGVVDTVIGAPHLNREQEMHEGVVGLFLQPLPIRIRWTNKKAPMVDLLALVKDSSQQALSNAISWETLCGRVKGHDRDAEDQALFDIMLTVHRTKEWDDCLVTGMSPQYTFAQGSSKFNCLIEWVGGGQDEEAILRIEYSNAWATAEEIETLASKLTLAARMMARGEDYREMRPVLERIRHGQDGNEQLPSNGV